MTEAEMNADLDLLNEELDALIEGHHIAVIMAAATRLMVLGFAHVDEVRFEPMLSMFNMQVRQARAQEQGVQ
jgi:hypothetical protein